MEVFRGRGIYTLASFYGVNFVCVAAFQDFEDGQMLQLVFDCRWHVSPVRSADMGNISYELSITAANLELWLLSLCCDSRQHSKTDDSL